MKILRLALATGFVTSFLIQSSLVEVAWDLDSRAGGALAVGLVLLSLLSGAGAIWQFLIAIGKLAIDSQEKRDREVLLLSGLFFLQIIPLAIVSGLASYPLAAASLALIIGLIPVTVSITHERLRS